MNKMKMEEKQLLRINNNFTTQALRHVTSFIYLFIYLLFCTILRSAIL